MTVAGDRPVVDVRKKAAWSLGEIGAPVTVAGPALQTAATSDPTQPVRALARARRDQQLTR